jgi:hypothetical protein
VQNIRRKTPKCDAVSWSAGKPGTWQTRILEKRETGFHVGDGRSSMSPDKHGRVLDERQIRVSECETAMGS